MNLENAIVSHSPFPKSFIIEGKIVEMWPVCQNPNLVKIIVSYDEVIEQEEEEQQQENKILITRPFLAFQDENHPLIKGSYYRFVALHLYIPGYFSCCNFPIVNGKPIINDCIETPIESDINALFAIRIIDLEDNILSLNSPDFKKKHKLKTDWFLSVGSHNCGITGENRIKPRLGKTADITQTNIHNMFFRFNNHYFTPVFLYSGLFCYYAFENKKKVKKWIEDVNDDKFAVSVDAPIRMNNILKVPITKSAKLKKIDNCLSP